MSEGLLEIERKLNITITMPQICHFCGEEITNKHGSESDSLLFHSLDGNHDNWDPTNKVPSHRECHAKFHLTGIPRPPEVRKKISESKKGKPTHWSVGDEHPMKDPEVAAKVVKTRVERHGPSGVKDPDARREAVKKSWIKRREKFGLSGMKPLSEEDRQRRSEAGKRGWITRRKRYPPNGMRLRDTDQSQSRGEL